MQRIELVRKQVQELYKAKHDGRADWADWMYDNHVVVVAEHARVLAMQFGADAELAEVAALLHDSADAIMNRGEGHDEKCSEMARSILTSSGYSAAEIEVVVGDALQYHHCSDGETPKTLEGKVLATADGIAHLMPEFYEHAVEAGVTGVPTEAVPAWIQKKLDHAFHNKLLFAEVQIEYKEQYESLKRFYR